MNFSNIEYKNTLDAYLLKGRHPVVVSSTDPPTDTTDVVTYNKWCLSTYLERLYNQKDCAPMLVFRLEQLKDRFFEKYYAAADKEETIMAEKTHIIFDDIKKITGNQYRYAVHLYRLIKSGREEMLFTRKFSSKSHEAFKHYALIYDLIKFKVFLEELSENLIPQYTNVSFGLSSTQIERLYYRMRGFYIAADTKLSNFQAVFNLHKIEKNQRIKWVHTASRNKAQLNKSTLFELLLSLNELNVNAGKQLNSEVYTFINNSFQEANGNDLPNLTDAYRNYKMLKDPNSINYIKTLVADIKQLKKESPIL